MSLELVNTAVERTVDLASTEWTDNGRAAKDTAAGAVLVSAIFAVLTGIMIMWQPKAFSALYVYFKEHILYFVLFLLSLVVAFIFIFKGFPQMKKNLPIERIRRKMNESKSAFAAIVGKANVGKSSILNRLIGSKIAIVSGKPQTTRTKLWAF